MPTCSQAKIITNLESDIHKRFIRLTNNSHHHQQQQQQQQQHNSNKEYDSNYQNSENTESTDLFFSLANKANSHLHHHHHITDGIDNKQFCATKSAHLPKQTSYSQQNYYNQYIQQRRQKSFVDSMIPSSAIPMNKTQYLHQQQHLQSSAKGSTGGGGGGVYNRIKSRRTSIDELPSVVTNQQTDYSSGIINTTNAKTPIIFGDFVAKQNVPVNFLYNSPFRTHRQSLTLNQARISSLRTSLNLKGAGSGSDGEGDGGCIGADEEQEASNSEANSDIHHSGSSIDKTTPTSESKRSNSSISPTNIVKLNSFYNKSGRKSFDATNNNNTVLKPRRNSIIEEIKQFRLQQQQQQETTTFNIASNNLDVKDVSARRLSGLLSQLPKLSNDSGANDSTTENESNSDTTTNNNNNNYVNFESLNNSDPSTFLKRLSLKQAKRLLALASIRPSKTFHKSMTEEEIEVLKKYYDLIKPKINLMNQNGQNIDDKYTEPYAPIVYDTAKVKFTSLQMLQNFLEKHKKFIETNVYKIEYEQNGFVLKSQLNENESIKFPSEINDAMFAFAVNTSGSGSSEKDINNNNNSNKLVGEANLFRIINWNDTTALSSNVQTKNQFSSAASFAAAYTNNKENNNNKLNKLTSINESNLLSDQINNKEYESMSYFSMNNKIQTIDEPQFYSSSSVSSLPSIKPRSPPSNMQQTMGMSFDFIKNLSSLVNSVIQPKLQKQLVYNGVDLSTLPGGANCEIPTFEELGINLNSLLADNQTTATINITQNNMNATAAQQQQQQQPDYQNSKLKNAAYKKLKEKINSNKCMWFNSPPERRPIDVIFEYAGVDMEHQTVLDEVNKYLKPIGGYVKSVEFIPRSVHLGSVYVENQWILTVSDQNTKFFLITNGVQIKDEKINVKSYDEFIFSEYEKFIRNEKYKQLIKNHERAVQQQQQQANKKKSHKSNK